MEKLLKIVFSKKSPSKNLKEALYLAGKLSGITNDDNVTIALNVSEVFNLWEYVSRLLPLIDKWKSFEIYFRDRLCVVHKDYRALFYAIQDIRSCYHQMQDDPVDFEKCDNNWGCRRLDYISLELTGYKKKYFEFGNFKGKDVWEVDKSRILNELETEISRKFLTACPAFSKGNVLKTLEALPNEIHLDESWDITYETKIVEGVLTDVPVSIEVNSEFMDFKNTTNRLLGNLGISREN